MISGAKIRVPFEEFEISFARSSGPGGQNVNKVNSKAIVRWQVQSTESLSPAVKERLLALIGSRLTRDGAFITMSDRNRDQRRNLDDCIEKIAELLKRAAEPPRERRATRPTKGSIRRKAKEKRLTSEKKQNRRSGSWRDDG